MADLRRLLNDELNADTVRVLLDQLRSDWAGPRARVGCAFVGLAVSEHAAMRHYLDRSESGASAEVFARRDGNAGDHCVSAAGHAWRYRGCAWCDGVEFRDQDSRRTRLDRSRRSSRGARAGRPCSAPPREFLDDLVCVRLQNCRRCRTLAVTPRWNSSCSYRSIGRPSSHDSNASIFESTVFRS